MPLHFRKASCVAVGTFNIYIIQPEWLTTAGVIKPETELTVEANLNRPGFRLSSPQMKSVWYVAPGRLAIETESPEEDCGYWMAEVLSRLRWTPIHAIGNNVSYACGRAEAEAFPATNACANAAVVPDDFEETRRQFGMTVRQEGRDFLVQSVFGTELVEVNGNANVTLNNEPHADRAVDVARQFVRDKSLLGTLFVDILGVRITNDVAISDVRD